MTGRGGKPPVLSGLGLSEGVWRGRISGAETAPEIAVTHLGETLPGVELLAEAKGGWLLSVPVPATTLGEGVQTYLIAEAGSGVPLGSFSIVAGAPLEADLRAEIDLMRAELDMLKKALRRLSAKVE